MSTADGTPSAPPAYSDDEARVKCWPKDGGEVRGIRSRPPAVGEYLNAEASMPIGKNREGAEGGKRISAITRFYYGRNVTGFMPTQPKPIAKQVKEYEQAADDFIAARDKKQVNPIPPTLKDLEELRKRRAATGETKGETKEGEEGEKDEIQVVDHRVQREDTYRRLALRYHTTVGVIKKWNRIKTRSLDNMVGRVLEIPVGRTFVDFVRDPTNEKVVLQQMTKAFMARARGCEYLRAQYYLQSNDMNLKDAVKEWQDDTEWEQQQTTGPFAEMNRDLLANAKKADKGKKKTNKKKQTKAQSQAQTKRNTPKETAGSGIELVETVAVSTTYI